MTQGTNVNIISTSQFAALMPDFSTAAYPDPTLSGLITSASQIVSDYLGYTPVAEAIVDEVREGVINSSGDLVVYPAKLPINSVADLTINKGATDVDIQLLNGNSVPKYNIDFSRTKIVYPYGEITLQGVPIFVNFYSLRGTRFYVKLSYNGGWDLNAIPKPIQIATALVLKHMINNFSETTALTNAEEISQGGISIKYAEGGQDMEGLMPLEAEKLLRPYRRVG